MAPATKYGGKMVECQPGKLATAKSKLSGDPEAELAALLGAGDTWTIL